MSELQKIWTPTEGLVWGSETWPLLDFLVCWQSYHGYDQLDKTPLLGLTKLQNLRIPTNKISHNIGIESIVRMSFWLWGSWEQHVLVSESHLKENRKALCMKKGSFDHY